MGVTQDLARFAARTDRFTDDIRQAVVFSMFDWATVGVAGVDEPVARATRAALLDEGGAHQATLFGSGRVPARAAALVNGATSHALDYDDTHFLHIGHPSVAVVPAALAVAERQGASGRALIDALALGLEVSCRLGDWLGRGHYETGFHQTGTAGAFGAAAAAGRVLGLDAVQMAHALGLTATRASGLKSQFGTMGKPLNAGFSAEVGVTCALLAQQGVLSNPDAIEAEQGFGPTHAGQTRQAAWQGMGDSWVFPAVSYKFHACCHGLHAMLEALQDLRAQGLETANVQAVTVTTHPRWLAVCNQPAPTTGLGAKFSYRLTAAMALSGVPTAALDTYTDAISQRPDLVALRDRVTVQTDDRLTDTQARVLVHLSDGQTAEAAHDLLAATDAATLERKLRQKSATLIGTQRSDAIWQATCTLETAPDVRAFCALM